MIYNVQIRRGAQKSLADIRPPDYERIAQAARGLASNPRPANSRKLKNRDGFRVRVGDYRILYTIDEASKTITIVAIGHRREIYR